VEKVKISGIRTSKAEQYNRRRIFEERGRCKI
jgi:hypothetical protein